MAIEFDCLKCGKALFAQDQYAGRNIRCPDCRTMMIIPAQSGELAQVSTASPAPAAFPTSHASAAPAVSPVSHAPAAGNAGVAGAGSLPQTAAPTPTLAPAPGPAPDAVPAPGMSVEADQKAPETEMRCPQCGQMIKMGALKCRFCGVALDPALQRQVAAVRGPSSYPNWRGGKGWVEFGASLDVGFEVFKRFWLKGAGMIFVSYLLLYAGFFVAILIAGGVAAALGGAGSRASPLIMVGMILCAVFFAMLISCVFMAGLVHVSVLMADNAMGKPVEPTFGDLFAGFHRIGSILGAMFLMYLAILGVSFAVGMAASVILMATRSSGAVFLQLLVSVVQIWFTYRLILTLPLIMDKGMGAVAALRTSWALTKGNVLIIFVTLMVGGLITALGILGLGVGVLFTSVIMMGIFGSVYRQCSSV